MAIMTTDNKKTNDWRIMKINESDQINDKKTTEIRVSANKLEVRTVRFFRPGPFGSFRTVELHFDWHYGGSQIIFKEYENKSR